MTEFEIIRAELLTFLVAAVPVIELRGAIPFGLALGLSPISSFVFSYLGSLLPAPFVLLLIRRIIKRFSHLKFFVKLDEKFQIKATAHSENVKKYGWLALAVFVAIPIPGTGVWSGSVIAAFLDIRFKVAFPAIAIGNLVAGIIIMAVSGLVIWAV